MITCKPDLSHVRRSRPRDSDQSWISVDLMNSCRERQVQHPFDTVAVYLRRRRRTLRELMENFSKLFSSKSSHDPAHNPLRSLKCPPPNPTLPDGFARARSVEGTHPMVRSSRKGCGIGITLGGSKPSMVPSRPKRRKRSRG